MKYCLFLCFALWINGLYAQYEGPIQPPSSGYGSDGNFAVESTHLRNDHYLTKDISVFYPKGTSQPKPTIFFSHGYGANDTTIYRETLYNLASNGYVVVFVPYKTIGATIPERYQTLYDGFAKAARNLPQLIDTNQVGFYGHSFGGGATPRISYRHFTENNWGTTARFIYCSAPWYSFELGTSDLDNFPKDCRMLMVLYDDDDVNDHRMGMDIFNNIAIDDSLKDCILVYSDSVSNYVYNADHNLPGQYTTKAVFNAHDYLVSFRFLNAMADYTFTGNPIAKDIALGGGSTAQTDIHPQLTPLSQSDQPSPVHSQSKYRNPCDTIINERRSFCQTILEVKGEESYDNAVRVHPNPTHGLLKITPNQNHQSMKASIVSLTGEVLLVVRNEKVIDLTELPAGLYVLVLDIDQRRTTQKVLKVE
ncbi:T9SS type A sorting domain-containing protein [bacterium SCSIO 12741]|nr:T9SS type A sorting domain-containing protein [bacterium SCSIO 12741]